MAVVVVHKNESINTALMRFQRQVIKEGIIADVLAHRWYSSKSEVKRYKEMSFRRSRRRRRRRAKKKPAVVVTLKRKVI